MSFSFSLFLKTSQTHSLAKLRKTCEQLANNLQKHPSIPPKSHYFNRELSLWSKVLYLKSDAFKNGDIVTFWQGNKLLIKRVIAGPGQWVDIDSDGLVSVDGQNLNESYLSEKTRGTCDIELPHQVKESHWFLMGDNRESSLDSRTTFIGDVSKNQIESKILFRIWPVNKIGIVR